MIQLETMSKQDKKDINSILEFWYEEATPKQKWSKDKAFDKLIKDKFLNTYQRVMKGETKSWRKIAEGRLAEIIILDQFSRNMFREDKQCFAGDELALKLAIEARKSGADKEIAIARRSFMYMPYMHSESKEVHKEALRIFEEHTANGGDEGGLKYEKIHKNIIDRFGRYPHRNKALGRESTAEELEYLKEHSGF